MPRVESLPPTHSSRMSRLGRWWVSASLALACGAAVAQAPKAASGAGVKGDGVKVPVVASFSVLGDMVREVGGERVSITVLVGPGADAHVYQPRPSAIRAVRSAQVVFSVGLGFEGWLQRLAASAGGKAISVEVAQAVDALETDEGEDGGGGSHDSHDGDEHHHDHDKHDNETAHHDHGDVDPHAWQDVENARRFVAAIAEGLCRVDRAGCSQYKDNASGYDARLVALDNEIKSAWKGVVPERRKVITSHDAFGYYSHAYGVRFLSPQGVSTQSDASARGVAELIEQIKAEKARAVFVETLTDQRLIQRIAREAGVSMSGALYADTLSDPDGPAPTYLDMMRYNTRLMVEAAR